MKNILSIISLGLFLSGCAQFCPKNEPPVIIAPTPHVYAPKVNSVKPAPIKWQVYNTNDLASLVEKSRKSGNQIVLFALDEINFKLLNDNLADIKRYIQQKNEALDFLEKAANAPAEAASKDGKK